MNLRQAVAIVLEGFTLPADARKILEAAYWADSTQQAETERNAEQQEQHTREQQ